MEPTRLILLLALAAGTTVATAAPSAKSPDSVSGLAADSGASIVVQNEVAKHRLEAQGFPQYDD